MEKLIDLTVRLIRAGKRSYARKWSFLGIFVVVFFGSIVVLSSLDLLPEMPSTDVALATASIPNVALSTNTSKSIETVELPMRIEIPVIGLQATIANPTTTNIEELDRLLLQGAVRYPTSAKLGETGNVVLFGHSSYLPIVGNQAYKTFNGIQRLIAGDVVTIYSADTAYTYRVRNVARESTNNAGISLEVTGRVLTLTTCNSFGTKEDRFVVTADFVESHSVTI